MKKVIGFLFLVVSHFSYAQKNEGIASISYDPSFWKEELHLNNFQYRRIHEINHEFYERLFSAYKEMHLNQPSFHEIFEQCLVSRNIQIWDAMNMRQRKKWKKMMMTSRRDKVNEMAFMKL